MYERQGTIRNHILMFKQTFFPQWMSFIALHSVSIYYNNEWKIQYRTIYSLTILINGD